MAFEKRSDWSPRSILEGLRDEIAVAVAGRNATMVLKGVAMVGNKFSYSVA